MPRGGKRANGGRPKGSKTKRKQAVESEAAAAGITPDAVMERAMLFHYRAKRYDKAAAIARDLAPYRHPRLAALTVDGTVGVQLEIVEEIVEVSDNRPGNGEAMG